MPEAQKTLSNLKLVGILLAFFLLGIISAYFPINSSIHLFKAIQSNSDIISFDKGAFYLFGGGLIFIAAPLWILYLYITKKDKADKLQHFMMIFFGVAFLLIFILPQIMSSSVGNLLEKRGYNYCKKQSRQWLFVNTMVYTKNSCGDDISSDR